MTAAPFHGIPEEKYEVTPLELLFDLVYAFAVSQLSHHLLTHLSWRGVVETMVMLIAIFAVWFTTSWSATMIRADQPRTHRLVLAVMLMGLFMNASVTRAFTSSGWTFVVPLLLIQVGRAVWTLVNSSDEIFRNHYFRVLIWLSVTTPLWIAGAAVSQDARLLWWALATGIDQIGRWLAHPIPGRWLQSENVAFDADHMLERCRQFLLIALGETVVTTGAAIAGARMTLMTLTTGTVAIAGTVALWALSFGRSHKLILRHVEKTSDPIRTSSRAVDAVMIMVAGLIAMAVANEMVISRPHELGSLSLSMLMGGGPILFLAAQGWYLWTELHDRQRLHLIGGGALLIVGLFTVAVPFYGGLTLIAATLTTLALFEQQ
ncbi:MAG: low temperature requirement protein A [Endomicrobiales bacterium]